MSQTYNSIEIVVNPNSDVETVVDGFREKTGINAAALEDETELLRFHTRLGDLREQLRQLTPNQREKLKELFLEEVKADLASDYAVGEEARRDKALADIAAEFDVFIQNPTEDTVKGISSRSLGSLGQIYNQFLDSVESLLKKE